MTVLEFIRHKALGHLTVQELKRLWNQLIHIRSDRVGMGHFREACSFGLRHLGDDPGDIFRFCTDDAYALEAAHEALLAVGKELDLRHA